VTIAAVAVSTVVGIDSFVVVAIGAVDLGVAVCFFRCHC